MATHFVYTDESAKKGPHFSNFYGGLVIEAKSNQIIQDSLNQKKCELNLFNELKWQKISSAYKDKYIEFIDHAFDLVESGHIKFRIMFLHNYFEAVGLSDEQRDNEYFLLYYQFIKHAFGFEHTNPNEETVLSLMMDQLPDKYDKNEKFKSFIANLSRRKSFREANVLISRSNIHEIDSKKHVQAQLLDIVLGAMNFRLNDLHLAKAEGQRNRGARTIAKERVYKRIAYRIRLLHPNFNIGITTGRPNGPSDTWAMPYRHWVFRPRAAKINHAAKKRPRGG